MSGESAANQPGSATDKATITVTISLDDAAAAGNLDGAPVTVEFTSAAHRHVLSVPVTALLATVQGSYAVEDVAADGSTRLVAVTLGIFAQGSVEVSSPDLHEGAKVAVASS
jgi:multidrug efflux pump subunit AcrA (membrane-fusion protein)